MRCSGAMATESGDHRRRLRYAMCQTRFLRVATQNPTRDFARSVYPFAGKLNWMVPRTQLNRGYDRASQLGTWKRSQCRDSHRDSRPRSGLGRWEGNWREIQGIGGERSRCIHGCASVLGPLWSRRTHGDAGGCQLGVSPRGCLAGGAGSLQVGAMCKVEILYPSDVAYVTRPCCRLLFTTNRRLLMEDLIVLWIPFPHGDK